MCVESQSGVNMVSTQQIQQALRLVSMLPNWACMHYMRGKSYPYVERYGSAVTGMTPGDLSDFSKRGCEKVRGLLAAFVLNHGMLTRPAPGKGGVGMVDGEFRHTIEVVLCGTADLSLPAHRAQHWASARDALAAVCC